MSVLAYSYDDAPTIGAFADAWDVFIRGLLGPFGSGKSAGCTIELLRMAQRQNPGPDGKRRARFAVIRNTYGQLKDTTLKTFMQWVPERAFGTYTSNDHRYVIDRLMPDLEIEVLFRALDRPDQLGNLLSLELTGAWVNEAREVPWTIIQALQGRVGRYPSVMEGGCVAPGIIMDTNPPDDDSWWYKLFEEQQSASARLFRQPGGRSPNAENIRNLPAGYYERMVENNDADFVKVYVDGEYGYVKEGKPVFPQFSDAMHVRTIEPNQKVKVYRGWDFGLTPACVFAQVLPDGRFLVFDELTADSLGIDAFSDAVLAHVALQYPWLKDVVDIGDPAGDSKSAAAEENATCFTILRSKQILVQDGDQTVETRLGTVRLALTSLVGGAPRFALHPRCKMLRKGFQGRYAYRRMKIGGVEERYHDAPDKNDFSHPHDALQYITARLFGNQLKGRADANRRKPLKYPSLGIV